MTTINSTTDIHVWLDNAGLLENMTAEEPDRVVELLADAEGRPAYGEDWTEYLDARAQALVGEVATGYDEEETETADDYSRRKPETRVGGAWSRRSRGD